jgi:hypothetical protein
MFTPQQYRAKAAQYAELVKTASSAEEEREFRKLETSFLTLASNTQWTVDNQDKILHPAIVDAAQRRFAGSDAAAIGIWNDEGGAPQTQRQQQLPELGQGRPSWLAPREQTDA